MDYPEYISRGNRNVPLGELRMSHMEIFEIEYPIPMEQERFDELPVFKMDSMAPCINGLRRSRGLLRFRVGCAWYVASPVSRRRMKCWKVHFPPAFVSKDEACRAMVQAMGIHFPELSGKFGTLVASKLLTCAFSSASAEELRAWAKYKEEQEGV